MIKKIIPLILLGSCAPRSNGEISDMAMECFKHKHSIKIEFIPHPCSIHAIDEGTVNESEDEGKGSKRRNN